MFIRRTVSKSKKYDSEKYYTYRLVESYRLDGKVKQRVLLNLGANFSVDKDDWSTLTTRIDDIIKKKKSLFKIDKELETIAQQYAVELISAQSAIDLREIEAEYVSVDVNSIESSNPKSIGAERIVYETIKELELDKKLEMLGATPTQLNSVLGTLISKACEPNSENKTVEWLRATSGAGELYKCDYSDISPNSIYRASDFLLSHKKEIETALYSRSKEIFEYEETITLYDLTNTYFEGGATGVLKAQRGRSKEKRSDAKLITLALVLDSSGFIKKSEIYEGNISEPKTLKKMIEGLSRSNKQEEQNLLNFDNPKSLVVMDAGIASEENIEYLKDNGYEYLVVSRKKHKEFCDEKAVDVKVDKDDNAIVRVQKVINAQTGEIELYCHSKPRAKKEDSMQNRVQTKFTEALDYLHDGLSKPKRMKKYTKVLEKVGALKRSYASIAKYYEVEVTKDPNSDNAIALSYKEKIGTDDKSAMNGVYCLRTNNQKLDEKQLWRTYTTLTDLEAVFRTLKTELGLRPIFHQIQKRVNGHLFITLIAYTIIHTIRYRLKSKGIYYSWESIRGIVKSQVRITTSMNCEDKKVLYIRKSSILNEKQKEIFDALGLGYKSGEDTKSYL